MKVDKIARFRMCDIKTIVRIMRINYYRIHLAKFILIEIRVGLKPRRQVSDHSVSFSLEVLFFRQFGGVLF